MPPYSSPAIRLVSAGTELSRTILKELLRMGAVRRVRRNHVQVVRRTYPRVVWDEPLIASFGKEIRDHLRAFVLALQGRDPPVFRRYVAQGSLEQEHAAILERDYSGLFNANINSLGRGLTQEPDSNKASPGPKNRLSATVIMLREPDVESGHEKRRHRAKRANRVGTHRPTTETNR